MFREKFVGLMLVLLASTVYAGYWSHKTIAAAGNVGLYSSIALDANGNFHISYYDTTKGDLMYAKGSGHSWTIETVDSSGNTGLWTSIAVDAAGNPHISYRDVYNYLKYAKKSGGSWDIDTVTTSAEQPSLALDANGKPHISFQNSFSRYLQYATQSPTGSWNIEIVDYSQNTGSNNSIAVDYFGNPHISYYDSANTALKYAGKIGNTWFVATVDTGTPGTNPGPGRYSSIALDASGHAHIIYYGGRYSSSTVMYARENYWSSWVIDTVDYGVYVTAYKQLTSIAIDANGIPHISYCAIPFRLKYAKKIGNSWVSEVVDSDSLTGFFNSIALDANGNPHISYYTYSTGDLRYATTAIDLCYPNGGDLWAVGESQTILWDGIGPIDIYLSSDGGYSYSLIGNNISGGAYTITVPRLATDAGLIKIVRDDTLYSEDVSDSYFAIGDQVENFNFRQMIIDASGSASGYATSIAFDQSGNLHVSYHSSGGGLMYAKKLGNSWILERVDASGALWLSMALDANGNPHISYYDGVNSDLKYAKKTGATWTIETVDATGDVGWEPSLALDRSGNPHISYFESVPNFDLKYAKKTGASWTIERVDAGGAVGEYSSIALDANDNPHISYYDMTNGDLKYAKKTGSSWTIEKIDTVGDVGWYTCIALDSTNTPHISYLDNTNGWLKYAKKTGDSWTIGKIGTGYPPKIAFDANCNLHISYLDNSRNLKYATKIDHSWLIATLGGPLYGAISLTCDHNNHPYIAYISRDNRLLCATTAIDVLYPNGGEVWSAGESQTIRWDGAGEIDIYLSTDGGNSYSLIANNTSGGTYTIAVPNVITDAGLIKIVREDRPYAEDISDGYFRIQNQIEVRKVRKVRVDTPGDKGFYTSLALDANGNPHISSYDWTNGDLRYAKKNGNFWTIEVPDGSGVVGFYSSLELDANGNPHISYYDTTNHVLKYARKTSSSWTTETVDATPVVGWWTSLALDTDGNPHISYYDATSYDLKYAKKTGTSWTIERVDTTGNVGTFTSIAVDKLGNVHISYYDVTNGDLKYAKKTGTSWTIEKVDQSGDVGRYTSIVVDADCNPHISYSVWSYGDLGYAKKMGNTWTIERVDTYQDVGGYTSITLDANSNPYIAYFDWTNGNLKYARKSGPVWVIGTLDTAGIVGYYPSIAVDANSNIHISYLDGSYGDLVYLSTALNILSPKGGETWNVGANATMRWSGPRDVDVYISLQGGDDWQLWLKNIAGTAEGDSYYYTVKVPHFPTRFARMKLVYNNFDPNKPINYAISDSFFTIQSTITLLTFNAILNHEKGWVELSWQTEPGVPDILGYNIYRKLGDEEPKKINSKLITENSYLDTEMQGGFVTYQLGAINGWNKEYIVGEVSLTNIDKPLAILPSVLKEKGSVIFDVPRLTSASKETEIEIAIYDVLGKKIKTMVTGKFTPGYHTFSFDGKDEKGNSLTRGTYFIIMKTPKYTERTKFVKL